MNNHSSPKGQGKEHGKGHAAKSDLSFETANFIHNIIDEDNRAGKWGGRVATRFPPEPNGYLHIGHAKAICLNFGTAMKYGGRCHLRFDDTNPANEKEEFVQSIQRDVKWLGFDWGQHLYHASDYFDSLYELAEKLIGKGLAYVCSLSAEDVRRYRGSLSEPGRESPDRNRPSAESLDLFRRMRAGEFADGAYTLRAKIDMASPNINMRDPAIYRIKKTPHQRTGDKWCIYPMYDYTHCLSDALEGITHSLCTLEFENHRPLYDWCIDQLGMDCHPQQIEFAPLNLTYVVTSKRRLKRLVTEGLVEGWDDPRMPTLSGLRRRGYPPAAIRSFCEWTGASKKETVIDFGILEAHVRDELNRTALRALAVVDPLKVVITNWPEDKVEGINVHNHPQDPSQGSREVPFSRNLYIERGDYMENAPADFFRLTEGRTARLRYGYVIRCDEVLRDGAGNATEIRCSYLPETLGGKPPADGHKVKGIIHWVSADRCIEGTVNLYERLFNHPDPTAGENDGVDFIAHLNDASSQEIKGCKLEPALAHAQAGQSFQFERVGYFICDRAGGAPVFFRTVDLRAPEKKG